MRVIIDKLDLPVLDQAKQYLLLFWNSLAEGVQILAERLARKIVVQNSGPRAVLATHHNFFNQKFNKPRGTMAKN